MQARLFFRTKKIKKIFFSTIKVSFLALFLVSNIGALVAPAFAQTVPTTGIVQVRDVPGINRPVDSRLADFDELFARDSTLGLNTDWNTAPKKASDLTFVLQKAKFNINLSNGRNAKWHWNKIADLEGDRNLFVLRFCNVGADNKPDESNCVLNVWPYAKRVYNNDALERAGFTPQELAIIDQMRDVFGADITTVTPELYQSITNKLKDLKTKKIHHYDSYIVKEKASFPGAPTGDSYYLKSDVEIDEFSMQYKPLGVFGGLSSKVLVPGQRYQADLWYCAAAEDGLSDISPGLAGDEAKLKDFIGDPTKTDRLRIFKGECDSNHIAYFRLAGFQFTVPQTAEEIAALNAQNQTPNAESNTGYLDSSDSILPTCSWFFGIKGSFTGCIAKLVYYLIYRPIAWIASLFGQLFDFFLGYSISDEAYRMGFAVEGWKLIRDISNIFFIIILVWTGFAAVFDIGNISMKKVVPTLIINALIINFSLFATRIVIDISNVFARVFYNTMKVQNSEGKDIKVAGYKSMSVLLVSAFDPQQIFRTDKIRSGAAGGEEYCAEGDDACVGEQGGGTLSASGTDSALKAGSAKGRGSTDYAAFFIVVCLLAALIMVSVAKMFWKVAFFFLGRTIGLYVSMIFSPFAFLTRDNVPLVGKLSQLKWSDWAADLGKYAMLAPIFILFLYIVVLFVNSKFTTAISGTTFLETVVAVAVPMLIIYFLMKQAVSIAETYAGRFGTMVQSTVDKATGGFGGVVGGGVGIAAGAAAFAGRNTVGRGLRNYGNQVVGKIKDKNGEDIDQTRAMRWAANADSSGYSRFMNNLTNKAQSGSWDIRNAGVKIGDKDYTAGDAMNKTFELFGEKLKDNMSAAVGLGGEKALGKGDKPGGILKLDEERAKKRAKELGDRIKYDHLSDEQAKQVWEEVKRKKIEQYGESNWEANVGSIGAMAVHHERVKRADEELRGAQATGGVTTADRLRITRAEQELKAAKDNVETVKEKLAENIRNGSNAAGKAEASAKAAEEEKKRLEKYGPIKNKAQLEVAMRGEYAENLKQQSQWLLGGKKGALGILGLSLGFIGQAIGIKLLGDVASQLNLAIGDINSKAMDKLIKDAKKVRGKGDQERVLSDKIDEIKERITRLVNKHSGSNHKKFDDFSSVDAEDAILQETITLEDEINDLKTKEATAKAAGNMDEYKRHRLDRKKRETLSTELKKAMENIDNWEEKLSKVKGDKERKEKDSENKPK